MEKKAKREAPLWVRLSTPNREWIDRECKRLGYSRSEFVDRLIGEAKIHRVLEKAKK